MPAKTYCTEIEARTHRVTLDGNGSVTQVRVDDTDVSASHVWLDATGENLLVILGGRSFDFRIEEDNGELVLTYAGKRYRGTVIDEHLADLKRRAGITDEVDGPVAVKAPMPGLVVKILVAEGDAVEQGQRLIVLEAMKMENDVKAPKAGVVSGISVSSGAPVEGNSVLLTIE